MNFIKQLNNNYITCDRCGFMLETVEQAVLHSVQCQPPQAVFHPFRPEHPLLAAIKAAQLILAEKQRHLNETLTSPSSEINVNKPPTPCPALNSNKPSTSSSITEEPVNLTTSGGTKLAPVPTQTKPKLVICKEAVDFRTPSVVKRKLPLSKQDEEEDEPFNGNNTSGEGSSNAFDVADNNSVQMAGSGDSTMCGKRHVCEFCQKSFHQKRTLVAHRRIHTGEKPYKCPICEAAFTQATHRNGHVKTHDPNFRPYSCSVCGRCFARKYSLTMHSYIHQGIFPFKCAFCEKKFRQAADMRKHEQRHVVHFSLLCRKCHLKFPSKAALERHTPICSRNLVTNSNSSTNDQATTNNNNNKSDQITTQ